MLIDTHAHLDFPDFAGEVDAVIERARGRRRKDNHGRNVSGLQPDGRRAR